MIYYKQPSKEIFCILCNISDDDLVWDTFVIPNLPHFICPLCSTETVIIKNSIDFSMSDRNHWITLCLTANCKLETLFSLNVDDVEDLNIVIKQTEDYLNSKLFEQEYKNHIIKQL